MIDTKAVRAWADAAEEEWDNEIIPKTLRLCAEEIDALRGQALSSIEREEYFALKEDAKRWQWLVRIASLGFDGAPSWNAVIGLPVFDSADQTITALVDRARKGTT